MSDPKKNQKQSEDNENADKKSNRSANATLIKCLSTLKRGFSAITVEPMIFLKAASTMMMLIIAQSLKMYKICRGTFNYDIEVCTNLTSNPVLEKQVQKVASDYGMYWVIIQTVPSIVFIVFLGPWSDRHGRKLPMILPLIGGVLSSVVFILAAQFEKLPPLFLLLGPLFAGISGGMMTMIMAVFSYVTDVTTPKTRTIRLGFVYGSFYLGSPIGSMIGGFLMKLYGYTVVFIVGTTILSFCLLYAIFILKEAPVPVADEKSRDSKGWFRDLFDIKNVADSFRTCFKKRPANKRLHLWILMIALCGLFLPMSGEGNVRYLYTRLKFNWNVTMYSYYTAAILAIGSIGVIFIMPFLTKTVGLNDYTMAILAISSKIVTEGITAFSEKEWVMFLGVIPLIYESFGPPIRSLMTKCLEPNEVGKAFAVLCVIESGIPILSGVMYSQVYKLTIDFFPGTVFLVSCAIFVLVIFSLIWLFHDSRKQEIISQSKTNTEKEGTDEKPISLNNLSDDILNTMQANVSTEVTISSL